MTTRLLNFLKKRSTLYHVGGWIIFIVYEISFIYFIGSLKSDAASWGNIILSYLINIGLFYFHALVVLNIAFGTKRRYAVFGLLFLSEMMLYLVIMLVLSWLFAPKGHRFGEYLSMQDRLVFVRQIWRGLYFILFSTSLWFVLRYFEGLKKLQEAETSNIIAQQEKQQVELSLASSRNAFLQAQINPHLLFNTLNFIHNKVRVSSPAAASAIITLSEMMRYSLADIHADGTVLLTNEVEQIENLIRINEFRFDNTLNLQLLTRKEDYEEARIIPLLLLPFVENIFKYGQLMDEQNAATVSLSVQDNTLHFQTHNQKRNPVNFHSQKIGIENVRKRLQSHYPNQFALKVKDEDDAFTVTLTINL